MDVSEGFAKLFHLGPTGSQSPWSAIPCLAEGPWGIQGIPWGWPQRNASDPSASPWCALWSFQQTESTCWQEAAVQFSFCSEDVSFAGCIRRPMLARGNKAAGLDLIASLSICGNVNQLSGYSFLSLEARMPCRSPPPDPRLRIRYITKNPSIFKPVFKA